MASEDTKEGWKNPTDIMRIHRIHRSRSTSSRTSVDSDTGKTPSANQRPKRSRKPSLVSDIKSETNALKKRKNPFMLEQGRSKQLKVDNEDHASCVKSQVSSTSTTNESVKAAADCEDRTVLEKFSQQLSNPSDGRQTEVLTERKEDFKQNVLNSSDESNSNSKNQQKLHHTSLPLDWSLKLKMRVVTNVEMKSKAKQFPGTEARNLHGFVHSRLRDDEWNAMDAVSQIRRCCFHYSFPAIPGLHKFPRLSTHYGNKPSPVDTTRQDVLDSLQSEWSRAFMSVYQQLRSSLCPYFYVCTHQFTALFRCLRSESRCVLSAMLSPTTRGFRELLKQEGVSFQLPRVKQHGKEAKGDKTRDSTLCDTADSRKDSKDTSSRNSLSSQDNLSQDGPDCDDKLDCTGDHVEGRTTIVKDTILDSDKHYACEKQGKDSGDEDDDDDEADDEDDAASSWLEEIGLESKHFPSLLPKNVKVQKERYQDIDNRLQSVLYMEGVDVHAFFNFLLNYPPCIASSGSQYGLPPTILSPSPFQCGTLVVNTVKQSVIQDARGVKQCEPNQTKEPNHVLEISGPILPHHALNVAAILQSQGGSSSLSFNSHPPTAAFNTDVQSDNNVLLTGMKKLLVPFASLDVGLVPGVGSSLLHETSISVKEVGVDQKGITWTS